MTNQKLYDFFKSNFQPGRVCLVGTNDFIGQAIRMAESQLTADKKWSRWSHAFLMGSTEEDGNFPILESDLEVRVWEFKVRNGAQKSPLEKWCKETVEEAAVLDFHLSEEQVVNVLSEAQRLVDDQVLYPVAELLGTWLQIIVQREWMPNPLDDEHAMYCSSYVRYCYQRAGADFLGEEVHLSNTSPEHIWQSPVDHTTYEFE